MKTSFCPQSATGRWQAKKAAGPHDLAVSCVEGMTARVWRKSHRDQRAGKSRGTPQATGSRCPTARRHRSAPETAKTLALLSSFHRRTHAGSWAQGDKACPAARWASRAEPPRSCRAHGGRPIRRATAWLSRRRVALDAIRRRHPGGLRRRDTSHVGQM